MLFELLIPARLVTMATGDLAFCGLLLLLLALEEGDLVAVVAMVATCLLGDDATDDDELDVEKASNEHDEDVDDDDDEEDEEDEDFCGAGTMFCCCCLCTC